MLSTLITATSALASVPTTVAVASVPSWNVTVIFSAPVHHVVVGQDVAAVVVDEPGASALAAAAELLLLGLPVGTEEPLEHLLQVLQVLGIVRAFGFRSAGAGEREVPQVGHPPCLLLHVDLHDRGRTNSATASNAWESA